MRSAEYFCSLSPSEPQQNSFDFCPSSGTLDYYRASVPTLSAQRCGAQLPEQGRVHEDCLKTHAEGLARALPSTGAANISMCAPASTATVIISAGINIPAGNGAQGHRAPNVTERQTGRPGVVRGRAGVRTHSVVPSSVSQGNYQCLKAGNMPAPSTLPTPGTPLSAVIFLDISHGLGTVFPQDLAQN